MVSWKYYGFQLNPHKCNFIVLNYTCNLTCNGIAIIIIITIIIIIIIIIIITIIILNMKQWAINILSAFESKGFGTSRCLTPNRQDTLSTSVRDHMLECDHIVLWDDFKVLGRESNQWLLEIKENLFIKRDKLSLNKNIHPQELFLF